jgi:hypothetical protein
MDEEQQLQQDVIQQTGLQLVPGINADLFIKKLAEYINGLINYDFNKLIAILYRLDVNEKKLRQLLALQQGSADNAGALIAKLIVERQLEKIKLRKKFKQTDSAISEEDKW